MPRRHLTISIHDLSSYCAERQECTISHELGNMNGTCPTLIVPRLCRYRSERTKVVNALNTWSRADNTKFQNGSRSPSVRIISLAANVKNATINTWWFLATMFRIFLVHSKIVSTRYRFNWSNLCFRPLTCRYSAPALSELYSLPRVDA